MPAEASRIGLCLSGGGFRAAFYMLGCLRYLAEADQLRNVVAVSSVSGGSIAAAALADGWGDAGVDGHDLEAFLRYVDVPFRVRITGSDLRRRWLLAAFGARLRGDRRGRGAVLGDVLGDLYRTRSVVDLPRSLQTIFTSTDLGTGRAFRISRDFIGNYDFAYAPPPPDLPLGAAVASSAAFPGVFAPLSLQTAGLGLTNAPPVLSLVDGGVYDNLGLEWFQGWEPSRRPPTAINADFLIVANASGQLRRADAPFGGARALLREKSVQYAQTLNVRIRWYVEWLRERDDKRGVYVGILRDPRQYRDANNEPIDPSFYHGALDSAFVDKLAQLRTDLDRFLPEEAALLSYHGYWSLHARMRTYYPDMAVAAPSWREYAQLSTAERDRLLALLKRGSGFAIYR
jgi:NTE family protein